ncbi:MAG TPA: UDP-N-acetylmuramoyl-tripeptide--D-alanyl-D-alanine ligase, partial [Chromatiaceae bacterium]|nr:UDP-N-acetylmuramoyl-tripeptide--D-alanyl-D-alanine ligase [Chromatiaceae bacterium]
TVKEMLAAILSRQGDTLATEGNLNNDIGVPLTLCRLQDESFAVVELGANHPGEIGYLSRMTRPDVAVLNNAGRAHLEGFGTVEGVARAKAEIIEGLAADGVFVYNADDPYSPLWRELASGRRTLGFGTRSPADISSPRDSLHLCWNDQGFHSEFEVQTPQGMLQVSLALTGEHNRMNALAAIAAARALGVTDEAIVQGLAQVRPMAGRLSPRATSSGVRVVDDSYNGNPDSVRMAVEVLCQAPGRKLLVLGDLGELGESSVRLHGELGAYACSRGVDLMLTCGRFSQAAADAFGDAARHFDSHQALLEALDDLLQPGDTVLVKGSRAAGMEKVVAALCGEGES